MSMEAPSNPYIDRLVGKNIETEGEKWHKKVIDLVESIGAEEVEGFELEKTPRDLEIIAFAEDAVNKLMILHGREKNLKIPASNVHVLKIGGTEEFTKGRLVNGAAANVQKSMVVDRAISDREFAAMLFHEMVHLKSYTALQVIDGTQIEEYRTGISTYSRDYSTLYLNRLEEIIVRYLESEFVKYSVDELPVSEQQEMNTIVNSNTHTGSEMSNLVDLLYEHNKEKFSAKEEIVMLLVDAQINGNLLAVARLLKDTYGDDALKKIDRIEIGNDTND